MSDAKSGQENDKRFVWTADQITVVPPKGKKEAGKKGKAGKPYQSPKHSATLGEKNGK